MRFSPTQLCCEQRDHNAYTTQSKIITHTEWSRKLSCALTLGNKVYNLDSIWNFISYRSHHCEPVILSVCQAKVSSTPSYIYVASNNKINSKYLVQNPLQNSTVIPLISCLNCVLFYPSHLSPIFLFHPLCICRFRHLDHAASFAVLSIKSCFVVFRIWPHWFTAELISTRTEI
jgi:hypothetical protein